MSDTILENNSENNPILTPPLLIINFNLLFIILKQNYILIKNNVYFCYFDYNTSNHKLQYYCNYFLLLFVLFNKFSVKVYNNIEVTDYA